MSRNRPQTYQDRITDEASEWYERVQDHAFNDQDRAAFVTWLQVSAEHVREYLQVAALWQDIEELGPDPDIDALISAAQFDQDQNILPLFDNSPDQCATIPALESQTHRRGRLTGIGIAASVVLAVIIVFLFRGTTPSVYQTGIGEQTSFPLPDGSMVTLNTRSEIHLRYTNTHRDIVLVAGEVLFEVVKEPYRTFRVLTDDAVIEAIGTRFNVHYRDADTTVTVVEGVIEVTQTRQTEKGTFLPVKVTVGQQARVEAGSVGVEVVAADLAKVTAWQQRRLVFESRPLVSVIDEFNLYNDPPIVIDDPGLEQLPISGAFNANDRASFLLFLEEMDLAQARTRSDGRILLSRKE